HGDRDSSSPGEGDSSTPGEGGLSTPGEGAPSLQYNNNEAPSDPSPSYSSHRGASSEASEATGATYDNSPPSSNPQSTPSRLSSDYSNLPSNPPSQPSRLPSLNPLDAQSYIISSDEYNQNQGHQTVRYHQRTNGRGYDKHEFETTNGIRSQEETEMTNVQLNSYESAPNNAGGSIVKKGSFSWTAPDGRFYEVRYTADAFGFHPEGDHIPKNLPVK
ncbi:unnamed protein product, partial [Allacma fusca]